MPLTDAQAGRVLGRWLGRPVACTRQERLHGGMCYWAFRLHLDRPPHRAVIKLARADQGDSFAREHDHLTWLHANTSLPCPHAYLHDTSCRDVPCKFLLLEDLGGVNMDAADLSAADRDRIDRQLAEALAELHTHTRAGFGGITETPGHARWTDIMLPRLTDLRRDMARLAAPEILPDIDAALAAAGQWLGEQGPPTLVHGDVWAGNIVVARDADGWRLAGIVDAPALQYADVEYELAYLEAWETVGATFFEVYTRHHALRDGYEMRRLFYWLHTAMLHVWLFDEPRYHAMTAHVAARLARTLNQGS